jgi:hypothetical protein
MDSRRAMFQALPHRFAAAATRALPGLRTKTIKMTKTTA